ncbi:MAG: hypothetical protein FJ106_09315 [Deltaproteobacteria bacterium]|nr:hypothetical protein [Deltaproteobacteria bacterium]
MDQNPRKEAIQDGQREKRGNRAVIVTEETGATGVKRENKGKYGQIAFKRTCPQLQIIQDRIKG